MLVLSQIVLTAKAAPRSPRKNASCTFYVRELRCWLGNGEIYQEAEEVSAFRQQIYMQLPTTYPECDWQFIRAVR